MCVIYVLMSLASILTAISSSNSSPENNFIQIGTQSRSDYPPPPPHGTDEFHEFGRPRGTYGFDQYGRTRGPSPYRRHGFDEYRRPQGPSSYRQHININQYERPEGPPHDDTILYERPIGPPREKWPRYGRPRGGLREDESPLVRPREPPPPEGKHPYNKIDEPLPYRRRLLSTDELNRQGPPTENGENPEGNRGLSRNERPPPLQLAINEFDPKARGNTYEISLPKPQDANEFDSIETANSRTEDKNRFDFNPTLPPDTPNKYNFNPLPEENKKGRNPAEVYKGNPFFRNVTGSITNRQTASKFNPAMDSRPIQTQTSPTITITNLPSLDPDATISFQDDFELVSKDSTQPIRPFDDVCGISLAANHLIFNGHVVPRGAYPWLAALFYVKRTGLSYICSGSLISDKHIVTAAHCVHSKRPTDLILILGKLNIQKWTPINGERIVEPSAINIHPDYESLTSNADIAIIVLSESIKFTRFIRPICLWRGSNDLERIVGNRGTVVGWGKDEHGLLMTEEPKQTDMPVVSQEKCLASNVQFHYITSNKTFCAGFRNGSGPCNGDSGGGFIMKMEGRWVLRGIVSLSITESTTRGCDLTNYVVFCDATKYTNWLLSFFK